MIHHLQLLGCGAKTAQLYMAGLKHGPLPATALAQLVNVKRPSVYLMLEQLLNAGLAFRTLKGKRTLFVMTDEQTLKQILENKRLALQKLITTLPREFKKLNPVLQHPTLQTIVHVMKGKQEAWNFIETFVSSSSEICWIGNLEKLLEIIPEKVLFQRFSAKRMSKKTTTRAITDRSIEKYPAFREHVGNYRQFRFVEHFESSSIVALWGQNVGILNPESDLTLVVINDPNIASLFQTMFNTLWNLMKTV